MSDNLKTKKAILKRIATSLVCVPQTNNYDKKYIQPPWFVSPQTNNYDKKYISYHKKWVVVLPHSGLWGHKPGQFKK